MTTPAAARPGLARYILLALVIPIFVVLVAVAALAIAVPGLPDPVGIHWNVSGQVDGFCPVWVPPVLLAAVGLGLPSLFAALTVPSLRRGDHGSAYRFLAAMNMATALLLTVLITWTTLAQLGLDDAREAPGIAAPMLCALVAAVGGGLVAWKLLPADPFVPTRAATADALELRGEERAVWLARASYSRGAFIALVAIVIGLGALAVGNMLLDAPGWSTLVLVGTTAFVALAVLATAVFHARVDANGLTVTSMLGYPRMQVPVDAIASVASVEVNPVGEFGGWGLRWAPPGRWGVVLRRGEGIEVRRTSGKTLTVTVDDAATGAALLEAYARRAHH